MATLESQISTVGVEHNASLRQKLEELASAMDRLDARQALRDQRASTPEMGIYESCVSALPDFSQDVHCPCASQPSQPSQPRWEGPRQAAVPPWIRAEVDWRRQHTEVLNQRIEVLEREKSLWEQKLRKLRSNSPGTSSRNKILQLFPKEPPAPADTVEALPGTVHTAHTAHAWGVGPSALKGSARDVYEKMLNPQPLQFIAPPRRERERLQEKAIEARKQQEERAEDKMQQELGQHLANRQELRSALQRELHAMRCLEAERQRGREALRATLQDELQQQLRQEKRAWQVEQERQELQRRAEDRRRAEVHQEMQRLELERLVDKLELQRSLSRLAKPAFDDEKLLELWKLRLAKDPQETKEISEVSDDLPADLLGLGEWLLFYGDLLNGTSRDKVADIDALEQAFMVMSHDQNCLDMVMVSEAKESLSTPGVMKMMLSYWLQHCDAHWRSSSQEGNLIQPPEGDDASIHSSSPLEDATVQLPAGRQSSLSRTSLDGQCHVEEDGPENAWPSRASVPEEQQTASLTQTLDPENAQRSQSLADEAGAQMQHTRTSLASRLQIQRHDDDAWAEAASQTGQENHKEEAAVTKERQASHSGPKAANDQNLAWQRTRTSLASRAPVQRHDDDAWESASRSSRGPKGPEAHKEGPHLMQSSHTKSRQLSDPVAADAKAPADHQRTSASAGPVQKDEDGWGSDGWGSARPSQASVPEDHKKQAASLTQSLYARYAERSDPATADDAKASADHQRTSASTGPVQKDEDGWGSDGWGSARPSQASVPEDHKKQAASLTQSLYARYAERSDPAAADDAKASADHQRTSATVVQQAEQDMQKVSSVRRGQDSSAPKPSVADQVAETVEEEEEVFTKEQWVNWFKTAELEEEEIRLLQQALQSLQDQHQLSPEEIAEALGSYQDVSEEDQDQLKEWAQWALEINDSD